MADQPEMPRLKRMGRDDHSRRVLEDRLAKPMFGLAILFLVLLAAASHLLRHSQEFQWDQLSARIVGGGLLLLWPVFLFEAVVRYRLAPPARRTWKGLARCLAIGLIPPLRMAAHSRTKPHQIWLPKLGWQELNFDLQKTLERGFGGPMFLMALLVLPLLAVEYFWSESVESTPWLRTALGIGVGLIWIAFAIEFIIRIAVAEKKLAYAFNHWVDLAVVLLPMLEFMPFLRILRATRLMRLKTIVRMSKYYRLYGLAGKGWRGLIVLEVVQRMMSRSPEARLSRLKGHLEDKQHEIQELEREVDYYRRQIQAMERRMDEEASRSQKGAVYAENFSQESGKRADHPVTPSD